MKIVHIHEIFRILDEHFWNTPNIFSKYLPNHLKFFDTSILFYFETLIKTLSFIASCCLLKC